MVVLRCPWFGFNQKVFFGLGPWQYRLTRVKQSSNQYIECWEYSSPSSSSCCCCSSCYVMIYPLHYQLVGTLNASLSHSPQTVRPLATCHLPPTDYHLPPAIFYMPTDNCQLPKIIFMAKSFLQDIFFRQKTRKCARRAPPILPKAAVLEQSWPQGGIFSSSHTYAEMEKAYKIAHTKF